MKLFSYKARDDSGRLITGEIEAEDIAEAKLKLSEQDLFPVDVRGGSLELHLPKFLQFQGKLKSRELIGLTRQFAALFKAGVPMDKILSTLSDQATSTDLKKALANIKQDVSSGLSLSDSFSKQPHFFSELYVNMLNVGEQAGTLDKNLFELAEMLKKEHRINANVKSATLYPKIVLTVFVAVFILMMVFVVPAFREFYSGYGAELPLPTLIMTAISNFIVNYWYIGLVIGIGGYVSFKRFTSKGPGRLLLDQFKFKLPVFGKLNMMVSNARFGHLVSSLYKSGLPIFRSLTIVANTIGNQAYRIEVEEVKSLVERGSSMADAMRGRKYFTSLMVESVLVGEKSGTLDDMLESTAVFYDEETSDLLDQLTTLIEPLLLIGIFVMVGGLALAIFLPMWKVSGVILGK
ncbi:MAG: type II secretion system F family protein [Pseudomonadota bacterium]